MMKRNIKVALLAVCAVLMLTTVAAAQPHPEYLHALSNLRYARALLQTENPNAPWAGAVAKAIDSIDLAIREIKYVATEDGKNLNDHPPIDPNGLSRDRLHDASNLIEDAAREVDKPERSGTPEEQKQRALHFIRLAADEVNRARAMSGR